MKVKGTSLLSISPLGTDENNNAYFGVRPRIEVEPHITDQYHTVSHNDRLDSISYKFYKTVFYWWVIADVNNIANPFDIAIGTQLRIPSLIRLQQVVKEAQNQK